MLTDARVEHILQRLPSLTVGVVGDLFLDRYLDVDAGLTEPSIETGLDAYQVVSVRSYPGAAGTVMNNLSALGVGSAHVFSCPSRRTPTYTKPMLSSGGAGPARELNRLDIKNRAAMAPEF